MSNWLRMIRVLIPLVAGSSLLASLISAIITADFLRDAKNTTGTIVASKTMTNDEGTVLFRPTFAFNVDGRDYSVTSTAYVSPSPGGVGHRVPVLFDPSKPSNARIDSFVYIWMFPTVTFSLGLVFGLIHFAIVWFRNNFVYVPQSDG